jgi:hypothetical protein
VAHTGEKRDACRVLVGKKQKERDRFGDLGVGGRIILKRMFNEIGLEGVDWINLAQIGTSGRLL